ncbi:phage tail protein [Acetobacter senegalensis]|uniref:phage tail protein n=1 Tax=Acetobacter senegalensis TaxID=446692 RepID=UPI001EDD1EA2|nr:phage tail protein [Acetobacter senegalensis]MCG4273627.1 phage tail protein [Acetobacter senegalensis]
MKQSDFPERFAKPIADSASAGNLATIPATQATAGDGTASVSLGFPPETFIGRSAGGVPPRGQDMNGFLHRLSAVLQAYQAGMIGQYDATFASGIGGYPAGAVVAGATPGTFWVSTAENNMTIPGANGAAWQNLFANYLPLAGGKLQGSLTIGNAYSFDGAGGYSMLYRLSSVASDGVLDVYSNVGGTRVNVARISADGSIAIFGGGHFSENGQQVATQSWASGQFATPSWVSSQFATSAWVSGQFATSSWVNGTFERAGVCLTLSNYNNDFATNDDRIINLPYGNMMQCFSVDNVSSGRITFPVAFSAAPQSILVQAVTGGVISHYHCVWEPDAAGFTLNLYGSYNAIYVEAKGKK